MLQCWEEDPTNRPSFQSITNVLAELLYPETKEVCISWLTIMLNNKNIGDKELFIY